jgi:SET domain-containing protein
MYDGDLTLFDYKIVSKVEIPARKPIMEFMGNILTDKQLPIDNEKYLQIGPNTYLEPTSTITGVDFISHSCDPNCMVSVVGNRAILYSLYLIPKNTELTIDYSANSTDTLDTWKMDCSCGTGRCRKVISGYHNLDENKKQEYLSKNMLPLYITHPTLIQKK